MQLLETHYDPEWTEALYGSENPLTNELDDVNVNLEQDSMKQFRLAACVCFMAMAVVVAVASAVITQQTPSWLVFLRMIMDRIIMIVGGAAAAGDADCADVHPSFRLDEEEEEEEEEESVTVEKEETAADSTSNNEMFPKPVTLDKGRLAVQIMFDEKNRYIGLFQSEEAVAIAVRYAENALRELDTLDLSEKETNEKIKCIVREAREDARGRVSEKVKIRKRPTGVSRHGNKFRAKIWLNKKSKWIGIFKTKQAAVIAHACAKEALETRMIRTPALQKQSEKETKVMMESIIMDAQEMGHRYDSEQDRTPIPIRKRPTGVSRYGKKFRAKVVFNNKTMWIGIFKKKQAAVIAHACAKEALETRSIRNPALQKQSEKETKVMMESIIMDAQEVGHRYDSEQHRTPIPTLPVVVVEKGGTNTAIQPRIATRKRSHVSTLEENDNETRSSKRLKQSTSGEDNNVFAE